MGEARRRKLAGTYPARTTPADEAAFLASLRSAPVDPAVERFLAGRGTYDDLTPQQRHDVDVHVDRIIDSWKPFG